MNEKRNTKSKFLSGTLVSDLNRQWRNLLGQLNLLEKKSIELGLVTIEDLIYDLKNVINNNQPNKKLFRVVQRKIIEIETAIKKIEFLLSQKNQKKL